jgi:hypothetical protein
VSALVTVDVVYLQDYYVGDARTNLMVATRTPVGLGGP